MKSKKPRYVIQARLTGVSYSYHRTWVRAFSRYVWLYSNQAIPMGGLDIVPLGVRHD